MSAEKTEHVHLIPKIERGIVIDHIPAGFGVTVLEIIRSYPGMKDVVTTVGLNYESTKLGRKDMLKLVTDELAPEVLAHLSLVTPGISIKRIRAYQVDKKLVIQTPAEITGKARCRNPNCISNHERNAVTGFRATRRDPGRYRCVYCERVFLLGELELITS
ncbi:MAG: aspartate carbamoyltransferase regulatory subunit [Deltaproteobacteria bacterium]|nr:aspartate carbamoyltransferase regulatory subunit [Deltaproteobacteria bacterium]